MRGGVVVQEVLRTAVEILNATAQPAVEGHEVDANVEGGRFLPRQVGVGVQRWGVAFYPLIVNQVDPVSAVGRQRAVGIEVRAACNAIAYAWLEALEGGLDALGKRCVGDFPGQRCRREAAPLLVHAELGAAFAAHRCRCIQHVVVVVVKASEETDERRFRRTAPKVGLPLAQIGAVAYAVPSHGVIYEPHVLVAALLPL